MAITQTNFRLNEEDSKKFREFCSENGWNQAEGFAAILEMADLSKLREVNPSRATEIDDFASHVQSIIRAFNYSLDLNNNTEARVRTEFERQLDSQIDTIADLRKQLEETKCDMKLIVEETEKAVADAQNEEKEAREEKEAVDQELKEALNRIETLTSDLSNTKEIAETYKASYHKCEEYETKLNFMMENEKNFVSKVNELEKEVEKLDREKAELVKDHQIDLKNHDIETQSKISEMEKKHQEEINELKDDLEDNLEDLEEKYEDRIKEMNISHKEEVSALREEIKQLRELLYSNK